MGAIRPELIWRYLRPHRRTVLQGIAALVVVNLLSVSIPLLVRRVIDDLQDGFALEDVRGAIRECLDLLKPGGRLFAFVGTAPVIKAQMVTKPTDESLQTENLFETSVEPMINARPDDAFQL